MRCLPNEEESIKLMPYIAGKRPLSDLVDAEKLMLQLSQLERCESRLSTFCYKFTVAENLVQLQRVLEVRELAIQQVRSHAFPSKIYQLILHPEWCYYYFG